MCGGRARCDSARRCGRRRPHRSGARGDRSSVARAAARVRSALRATPLLPVRRRRARRQRRHIGPDADPLIGTARRRPLRGRVACSAKAAWGPSTRCATRARQALRAEGPARRSRARRRARRALHPGGAGGGGDRAPEHRRDHRLRPAARAGAPYFVMELLGRRVRWRAHPKSAGRCPRAGACVSSQQSRGGARGGARRGRRPPRSQARQRVPRRANDAVKMPRLRRRQGGRRAGASRAPAWSSARRTT